MVGRTRPPYPAEFKAEAVQLARTSGQPLRTTAQDLGVSIEALRGWVKQADVDAGEREGLTSEERAELSRLRREIRVLKEEREILRNPRAPRHFLLIQKLRSATVAAPERSGRWLTGASEPVAKHGPGVAADLRVVTPFRRSRLGK
jgi:transposase